MCFNELDNLRFVQKVVSGVPNVPPTNHPSEGGWDDNSLFEGEVAMDSNTGFVYIRNGAKVVNITTGKPSSNVYSFVVDDADIIGGNSTDVRAWTNMRIISKSSLNGQAVATIEVNGLPYTLGVDIDMMDTITYTHAGQGVTRFEIEDI